jgi:glycosyltransferase involved in cell wall biosynthesis
LIEGKNYLSIVIPVYNEEENISPLVKEIVKSLHCKNIDYELILVNDGSTDSTQIELDKFAKEFPQIKIQKLQNNIGQGLALAAGIDIAKYPFICTLDGDLQFSPENIVTCYYEFLNDNLGLICGRRAVRNDDKLTKTIPSIAGNKLISILFNTDLSDVGCSLKIFHKKDIEKIIPFKNYHRYISILLIFLGVKYKEVSVEHRERKFGESKYTTMKFIGVLFEVLWMKFIYLPQVKQLKQNDQAKISS